MKSCLGVTLVLAVLIGVIGGGAFLWLLSADAEFTRTAPTAEETSALPAPAPEPAPPLPEPP